MEEDKIKELEKMLPDLENDEGWETPLEADYPWKPQDPGDEIRGYYLGTLEREKEILNQKTNEMEKRKYYLILLLTKTGIASVSETDVLKEKFTDLKIELEDGVRIRFTGKKQGQGGFQYNTYKVAVKRHPTTFVNGKGEPSTPSQGKEPEKTAPKPPKNGALPAPEDDGEAAEILDLARTQLTAAKGEGNFDHDDIIGEIEKAAKIEADDMVDDRMLLRCKNRLAWEITQAKTEG